jgi:hypothetical protein
MGIPKSPWLSILNLDHDLDDLGYPHDLGNLQVYYMILYDPILQ